MNHKAKFVPPTFHSLDNTEPDQTSSNLPFIYSSVTVFSLVFFTGLSLDIFVIYVMVRSRQLRKNTSSFLLFHLSLTHLLFHVVVPSVTIRGNSLRRTSNLTCKVSAFIEHACPAAIFSTLVAIAWDRHKNILQPFKSLVAKTVKSYLLLVAIIWTYAVISSASFVISTTLRSDNICSIALNNTEQKCEEFNSCRTSKDWKIQISVTFYFLMAFVIPLSYMTIAYTRIAVRLWKRSKNGMIHSAVANHKTKSIRLLLVAILGFAICWSPSILINLLDKYGVLEGLSLVEKVKLKAWSQCIAPASSSLINTAVYAYFSPEFRKNCVKFGCCCCSCKPFIQSCSQCGVDRRVGSDETSMKRFTRASTAS